MGRSSRYRTSRPASLRPASSRSLNGGSPWNNLSNLLNAQPQPLTTIWGLKRATLRPIPAPCVASMTSAASL